MEEEVRAPAARLDRWCSGWPSTHGLGNDFLIQFVGCEPDRALWSTRAVAWCDRHRGVGADGLIVASPGSGGTDLAMALFNADGSIAEISGNGPALPGPGPSPDGRAASMRPSPSPPTPARACAGSPLDLAQKRPGWRRAWGSPGPGPEPDRPVPTAAGDAGALALDAIKQRTVDMGNPHLVLLVEDVTAVDIAVVGHLHEAAYDGGINAHAVAPTPGEADALTIVHWERGVGVTDACGSGACAAAVAARAWGLVGERVTVHMPGGDAEVRLDGAGGRARRSCGATSPRSRSVHDEIRRGCTGPGRPGPPRRVRRGRRRAERLHRARLPRAHRAGRRHPRRG